MTITDRNRAGAIFDRPALPCWPTGTRSIRSTRGGFDADPAAGKHRYLHRIVHRLRGTACVRRWYDVNGERSAWRCGCRRRRQFFRHRASGLLPMSRRENAPHDDGGCDLTDCVNSTTRERSTRARRASAAVRDRVADLRAHRTRPLFEFGRGHDEVVERAVRSFDHCAALDQRHTPVPRHGDHRASPRPDRDRWQGRRRSPRPPPRTRHRPPSAPGHTLASDGGVGPRAGPRCSMSGNASLLCPCRCGLLSCRSRRSTCSNARRANAGGPQPSPIAFVCRNGVRRRRSGRT